MLDETDHEWLSSRGFEYEVIEEGGLTNLIIKGYALPPGFDHDEVDLLVQLPPGFPDTPPDMFWVDPWIKLSASQTYAPASEHPQEMLGRRWQRFSRHLGAGAWRPGIDSLATWMSAIRQLLIKDTAT
jgi:hypothetical protein